MQSLYYTIFLDPLTLLPRPTKLNFATILCMKHLKQSFDLGYTLS